MLALPGMGLAQSVMDLDPSQLSMLEQLDSGQREALLERLRDNAALTSQEPLALPDLVRRERVLGEVGENQGIAIYDEDGLPLLDKMGRPIRVDETLLEELKQESPDDWYASKTPFFEQKVRLEPFGYSLFEGAPTTFAPATDIPVPNEYRLGPGDTIEVQLFGKENRQIGLIVNRDGTINFPNIGPLNVMGLNFQELKQAILDQIAEQLIGTSASVTMGALRSITVLIVGDAQRPGSYTVSGLSTITNALLASGGVSPVGSLRAIELRRDGKLVTTLDLYDLLLNGDSSKDLRLESGDIIFIPPVGPTVGVGGFVRRPAVYEVRRERTAAEMISIAGGLRPDAYPKGSRIERIDRDFERVFVNLDLSVPAGLQERVEAGDVLLVPPVLKQIDDGVRLLGHVTRAGIYAWQPGMRLTDLLPSLEKLRPQADINYVLIRRETQPKRRIQVLSANLEAALANPGSPENVALQARDEVSVFRLEVDKSADGAAVLGSSDMVPAGFSSVSSVRSLDQLPPGFIPGQVNVGQLAADRAGRISSDPLTNPALQSGDSDVVSLSSLLETLSVIDVEDEPDSRRGERVAELLEELERQSGADMPFERITVSGQVRAPGDYPFEAGMRVSDLIRAGAGFTESAFPLEAELTRYEVIDNSIRSSRVIPLNLNAALAGNPEADVLLLPSDFLTVRRIQNWDNELTVFVEGEVRYPGRYTVRPGDTLSSVLDRAGGLTSQAFPEGGIFLRKDLKEREQQQIDALRERLRGDVASLSLQAAGSLEGASVLDARSAGSSLLATLNSTEATGRLVIDLPALLAKPGDLKYDVLLKDGDRLLVPRTTQAVTVIGEVQFPTSHLFVDGLDRDGYIERSGGLTPNGAKKRIYLVRANGAVLANSSKWFRKGNNVQVGDTIVVPLDTQRGFRLQAWANITTIVYNAAIAVAAINGLN
ncbi:MAG: SLBB domain-containing protein [Gammaproteobacteria bacterium]|jgi:protein involved in polysaccharide export with SLBB domain|nr:SLBB domain-containing protein [Gammaproteobacteria bacterium]